MIQEKGFKVFVDKFEKIMYTQDDRMEKTLYF